MECQYDKCGTAATMVSAGGCLEQQHIVTYYYCDEHAKTVMGHFENKDLYCLVCQKGAPSKYSNPKPIAELLMQKL